MNRKRQSVVCAIIVLAVVMVSVVVCIWFFQRGKDPQQQVIKEINRVHEAIIETDENWELKTLSKVYPYEIKNPDGPSIFYYCCVTSYYLEHSLDETERLDKVVFSQIVDVDSLENTTVCDIKGSQGIIGEIKGRKYLCWTISPVYSCILEYTKGSISEAEILRIAESVNVPEK